ncbi:hypothetical protein NE619_02190 [Anaerovorax odorimutans]|uniref:NEAT domain-containing protein n=1 Tax=Anaerovorax odorimutans TaxID=109327 RepID=A0ABT1RK04_9FIRM|nr:hypothetical protein [Anaerovorax odorimutans]MCQ4635526.1 hypothetical protein [Anaerovorax odorimutans]
MKRLKLFILLSAVLVLLVPQMAFAAVSEGDIPDEVLLENELIDDSSNAESDGSPSIVPFAVSCSMTFTKLSSSKAQATVVAARAGASSITSTIRLQYLASGGSYKNANAAAAVQTVKSNQMRHVAKFGISSKKKYRIKVTIKYVKNGTSYSNTYYKALSS